MRRSGGVGLAAVALATSVGAAELRGLWWVEGGAARLAIEECRSGYCGRVVWLRSPLDEDGCPLRDHENPDERLRDRPLVGLTILEDLRADPDEPGVWRDGRIYDPASGRRYSVVARADGPDRLHVRGYVGFELLGRTTTWVRVGRECPCEAQSRGAPSRRVR